MPEVKFVLKEPSSDQKTLIYLFYNFNGQRLKYSTGQKVMPKLWNPKKQRVKEVSNFAEHLEFNQYLNKLETVVNNSYRKLLNDGVVVTPKSLREELNKEFGSDAVESEKKLELLEWIEAEIQLQRKVKKNSSILAYKTFLRHLNEFERNRRFQLTFNSINMEFYHQFMDYLINDRKMLTNTVGKHIKTMKTFMNIALEKGLHSNLNFKNRGFKVLHDDISHIYLSSEELDTMFKLDLSKIKHLEKARDFFLIGCFTGLRFNDFIHLKPENIENLSNGQVLNIKTSKTGQRVVIPLKSEVKQILERYDGILPKAISNQKLNSYIKEVGKIAGITKEVALTKTSGQMIIETRCPKYELISSHTARRSFATNAFLSGVPSISIMKLTGHRTESSFMKYIKVSQERNAESLMNHPFFK